METNAARDPSRMEDRGMALMAERVLESHTGTDAPHLASFIGGRYDDAAGEAFDVFDPATGGLLARITDAGAAGVDRATVAAEAAFPAWRALAARDRAALIS